MSKLSNSSSPFLSDVKIGLSLLSPSARLKMFLVTSITASLSIFDLVAVGLLGLSASISIRGVQSQEIGDRGRLVTDFFGITNFELAQQVAILSTIAVFLFLVKTLTSVWLSRKILFFMQNESARTSIFLLRRLFESSYALIRAKSVQERLYATTIGVNGLIVGVVGALFLMSADIILLSVLVAGLIYLEPLSGAITTSLFILIAYALNVAFHKRASEIGKQLSANTVRSNEAISELLMTIKDRRIRGSEDSFLNSISESRMKIAHLQAEMKFVPSISKYVFEIGLVFITITITLMQFYLSESSRAVANLVVFLAASGRIAPAILRIQQGVLGLKSSLGVSLLTQQLIKELDETSYRRVPSAIHSTLDQNPANFAPILEVKEVSFAYANNNSFSINNLNLEIPENSFTALVGPSGGGKTTIFDLFLGFLEPIKGQVLISNLDPKSAIELWPGKIGYVPQEPLIVKGTLKENILLGIEDKYSEIDWEELIFSCGLGSTLEQMPLGLETVLNDFGTNLSGGQRQRIGIARAVIQRPQIIFLDEATSALDAKTENLISKLIYGTKEERACNNRTVISIAHRISSIREADRIIFIDEGQVMGEGNFNELIAKLPSFAYQAQLMGLDKT